MNSPEGRATCAALFKAVPSIVMLLRKSEAIEKVSFVVARSVQYDIAWWAGKLMVVRKNL